MKTRPTVYWLVAIAMIFIGVLIWRGKRTPETPQVNQVETDAVASVTAQNLTQTNNAGQAQVVSNGQNATSQPNSQPPRPSQGDKVAIMTAALNANDADILFYGRLEDQFSNGVPGAEVNFSIQYENASDRGIKRGQAISDGSGMFTISGYIGENLGLMPKKPGYVLATNGTSFRYSQISPGFFVPDASNPTVIKMWKLQGSEPLTGIDNHYKIPYTSAPMNFDLLTGQMVESGGDIRITVNRPPGVISGQNRLDWSLQIEAVAGGLIDAAGREKVTYSAPDSGYQPSLSVFASTNGHGVELIQQGLFMQSRKGQVYSKVGITFRINSEPDGIMYINFSGIANANGSRNWEGDPNTMNAAQ